jgi:energy-coupling factor transport system ATP-binding protein
MNCAGSASGFRAKGAEDVMDFQLRHVSLTRTALHVPSREILHDITLSIPRGARAGIIGSEGSGKSTLMQVLAGLLKPSAGEVLLDGVNPWSSEKAGVELRRRLGVTFQFPEEGFLRPTVGREFVDVLTTRRVPREAQGERMRTALEEMGLDPAAMDFRSPFTLSLGESRLVSIALALAVHPEGILLDEPTSGLDARGVKRVRHALSSLRKGGRTIVIATHDLEFLREESDAILILEGGHVAEEGPPGEVLKKTTLLEHLGLQTELSGIRF